MRHHPSFGVDSVAERVSALARILGCIPNAAMDWLGVGLRSIGLDAALAHDCSNDDCCANPVVGVGVYHFGAHR